MADDGGKFAGSPTGPPAAGFKCNDLPPVVGFKCKEIPPAAGFKCNDLLPEPGLNCNGDAKMGSTPMLSAIKRDSTITRQPSTKSVQFIPLVDCSQDDDCKDEDETSPLRSAMTCPSYNCLDSLEFVQLLTLDRSNGLCCFATELPLKNSLGEDVYYVSRTHRRSTSYCTEEDIKIYDVSGCELLSCRNRDPFVTCFCFGSTHLSVKSGSLTLGAVVKQETLRNGIKYKIYNTYGTVMATFYIGKKVTVRAPITEKSKEFAQIEKEKRVCLFGSDASSYLRISFSDAATIQMKALILAATCISKLI